MTKFAPINGWTKRSIKEHITARFKGKSLALLRPPTDCAYRGEAGRACAVGVFIPDDLYTPEMEGTAVEGIFLKWPNIIQAMPLPLRGLIRLQRFHDGSLDYTDPLKTQLDQLLAAVDSLVAEDETNGQ